MLLLFMWIMEEAGSSETSVTTYQAARHYFPNHYNKNLGLTYISDLLQAKCSDTFTVCSCELSLGVQSWHFREASEIVVVPSHTPRALTVLPTSSALVC